MDAELLKRIDRLLSRPLAWVAWACAVLLCRRPDPRILVVRPGGMGDLILAELALDRLGVDQRDVLWLIEKRSAVWARNRGLTFLEYDESLPGTALRIAGRHRTVVNTEQLFGLAGVMARLATQRGGSLTMFDTNRAAGVATATVAYDPLGAHELHEFTRLFEATLPERRVGVAGVPRRADSDGHLVLALGGLHAPSRTLSVGEWVSFVKLAVGDRAVTVTASPIEAELADQVCAVLGDQARRFRGSFAELVDLISRAKRVVAIDGGPVHIASFFGVPCDVLFTAGRYDKWAPLGEGSRIYRRTDLSCQPCTMFGQVPPCPIAHECRKGLPEAFSTFRL